MRTYDPRFGTVPAAGQRPTERSSRWGNQKFVSVTHSSADHEHPGIECRGQIRDTDSEPVTNLGNPLGRLTIPSLRLLGHQLAFDAVDHTRLGKHPEPEGGAFLRRRSSSTHQHPTAGVLLPAPAVAALAWVASRHDLHVTELAGDAELAAVGRRCRP